MGRSSKRIGLGQVDKARAEQDSKRIHHLLNAGKLKCRVTGQFLPGEESPFEDDNDGTLNKWRVTLIPEDDNGAGYISVLENKSFPISGDPDVVMQTYGSHGLLNKTVMLEFNSGNVRATGEVNLQAASNFGPKNKIDASDVAVAKTTDLGPAFLP